jgi:hypothetical protein
MSSAARPVPRRDPPANPGPMAVAIPVLTKLAAASEAGGAERPTPHAILRSARDRLADPLRWLDGDRDHEAVNGAGRGCLPWDAAAVRWDLWGAIGAAGGTPRATDIAVQHVARAAGLLLCDITSLSDWQDAPERTHAQILAVLDAAIEAAARAS